jgi:hypothetical protein
MPCRARRYQPPQQSAELLSSLLSAVGVGPDEAEGNERSRSQAGNRSPSTAPWSRRGCSPALSASCGVSGGAIWHSRVTMPTRRPLWPFLSLIPFGLGAWAPIYAGVNARRRSWILWGVLWTLIAVAGWITAVAYNGGGVGGLLLILGWAGGAASSFTIARADPTPRISPLQDAEVSAEQRLGDRERARRLARDDPALAAEMGIGRPDRPGTADAGLVDVNNAPGSALTALPGVDDALAARILATRSEVHGFSSLEDFGTVMDVEGRLVEGLRERAIFLPPA